MIDMHCHLDLYPDPHQLVAQCVAQRLYVLSVTTVPSAFEGTLALVPVDGRIRTALGLHPELAVARERELPLFEQLLPQTRYVGEVGLDGSRDHRATLDRQADILANVLRMCVRAGGRTISLHSRGAIKPLLDQLAAEPAAGTFILHWFLGSARQIERAVEMGCWFSVGPSMLTSVSGTAAVAKMPIDRVLPESDGPFALIKERAAYPWEAWKVVPNLAKLWGKREQEVEDQLMKNFKSLVVPT
jgi:TatD DNase family protein